MIQTKEREPGKPKKGHYRLDTNSPLRRPDLYKTVERRMLLKKDR